ncbi:unnamed protein product [Urochloa humidicola]
MGRKKNGGSGAGFLKPLGGVSPARMPGAGAVFLVGSALGFVAVLHASESEEIGGEWASAARWAARSAARRAPELVGAVGAHQLLVAISLLFLAASVWRLGKRCAAVEGLAGSADSAVQALRVGGVVCAVCGSKIQALKRGRRVPERTRSDFSNSCSDKPVSRSLAAEFEQEADKGQEDNARESSDSDEDNVQYLKRKLKGERLLKEVALEELEKERLAAASAADEAMAKIACLRSEKALVEREARQLQEMAKQKQLYDRQVIESLQWVIMKSGMQGWEPEAASDPAVSETSEDDRDRK